MRIDLPNCPLKYCRYQNDGNCTDTKRFEDCPTRNMIEIPNNVTNGEVIRIMFPNSEYIEGTAKGDKITMIHIKQSGLINFSCYTDWWNAPYKTYKKEGDRE